jgi:hypothetical protein
METPPLVSSSLSLSYAPLPSPTSPPLQAKSRSRGAAHVFNTKHYASEEEDDVINDEVLQVKKDKERRQSQCDRYNRREGRRSQT